MTNEEFKKKFKVGDRFTCDVWQGIKLGGTITAIGETSFIYRIDNGEREWWDDMKRGERGGDWILITDDKEIKAF